MDQDELLELIDQAACEGWTELDLRRLSLVKLHQGQRPSAILMIFMIIITSLGVISFGSCIPESPDPDSAMRHIIQAAAKGNERYIVDHEIDRGQVPNTAISRRAWDVLAPYANELPFATVAITTRGNQMDLVSSEIQIVCPSLTIRCTSDNGQVVSPRYFYVYTCTAPTASR